MRKYEIMFIVRPDASEEDLDKILKTLEANITANGGQVTATEKVGKRRLAYTVNKFNEGNYMLLTVEGPGSVVKETERRLRVAEPVLKFITVRIDEEEKRLAKVKKLRDAKVRGKGTHAAAAAAEAAAAETAAATTDATPAV
jgi:small subunit ribosomal protein S6